MVIPHILKPSRKKIVILGAIVLAIFFLTAFFRPNKQAPLEFVSVKKQDIKSVVSSSGQLTGKTGVDLKFKGGGKLSYLKVKTGDQIEAGQTVAGLDTQQLAIDLQQAQNTLKDKQAIVDKTLDDVKDHDKDETFTQRQSRTTAQVARDNAYDEVKAAQRAFQDALIISPISGIVTQAPPIPGQIVSASDLIAQVVDFSQIFFDTDIDETDIGKISLGQKAEATLDAYPDKIFDGTVEEIIPQTKTTSSGATVVTVKINLGNPAITLVNGLSGQASIIFSEAKNVLTIPQEALREDNSVVIQTQKGVESKKVVTGIKSDTDVEIKVGLEENDKVVYSR